MLKNKWLCSFICFSGAYLAAQPQDPIVIQGTAQFDRSLPDHTSVHTSDKAIIDWKSFSIDPKEVTEFIQPRAASAVLNRVTTGLESKILGHLKSNGRLYLINPAGILIGKEGLVQTAGFIASTLDMSDKSFLEGDLFAFQSQGEGSIINLGTIESEGDVGLFGQQVVQKGQILATQSRVFLAAGNNILFQPDAEVPLYIRKEIDRGSIENSGLIQAGYIELTAAGLPDKVTISQTGHLDALHVYSNQGKIFLQAKEGRVISAGTLEASTSIAIVADTLDLTPESQIKVPLGNVSLQSTQMLTQGGMVAARSVAIDVQQESPFIHTGSIEGSASITLKAPKFLNGGRLVAGQGGTISIDIQGASIETASSYISAPEGSITHRAGTFFSSGRYEVGTRSKKGRGGSIDIFADHMNLVDAHLDATAPLRPGSISVGVLGDRYASHLYVSPTTQFHHRATHAMHAVQLDNRANNKTQQGQLYLAPQALQPQNTQTCLCATSEAATCMFSSTGEFVNPHPASFGFGAITLPLLTGNVVIANSQDDFANTKAGIVYLFNGNTGALISTITGSSASDQISLTGITALTNGNFVVSSPFWDNVAAGVTNSGAATWIDGTLGLTGTVSSSNSLVGGRQNDVVSNRGITGLTNGNYVVGSADWNNPTGPTLAVGAATWGNGSTGITGTVSSTNSLIGSTANDSTTSAGITALMNGNYVVGTRNWDNVAAGATNSGAATWGNGSTGTTGTISTSNSLVGTSDNDQVGSIVVALANGNYVAANGNWNNPTGPVLGVGAVTWGNGSAGTTGTVSAANSLIGSTAIDAVGFGVVALSNGNYVVRSPLWNNPTGPITDVGAATWRDGSMATSGTVSTANSLIGSTANDEVSFPGVVALSNGNYVVLSSEWNNSMGFATFAGAATWGNGASAGVIGTVSATNSLVGSTTNDRVTSSGVAALTNGNYVVSSPNWDDGGTPDVGAATWGNGTTGSAGTITMSNSLIGSSGSDNVASGGVTALTGGNYVVKSPNWDDGATIDVGAATWGNGSTGIAGTVSAANSLMGSGGSNQVSSGGVINASSNFYVVSSPNWGGGAGAVTVGCTGSGSVGIVSSANSFVSIGSNTDLRGVVFNSVAGNVVMPFLSEDNGRVFFGTPSVFVPTPSNNSSTSVESRGLTDFRASLSETFQEWGPFFLGGTLSENLSAPYLTYKNVNHKLFPSLIREESTSQERVFIKEKRKRKKLFGRENP